MISPDPLNIICVCMEGGLDVLREIKAPIGHFLLHGQDEIRSLGYPDHSYFVSYNQCILFYCSVLYYEGKRVISRSVDNDVLYGETMIIDEL